MNAPEDAVFDIRGSEKITEGGPSMEFKLIMAFIVKRLKTVVQCRGPELLCQKTG